MYFESSSMIKKNGLKGENNSISLIQPQNSVHPFLACLLSLESVLFRIRLEIWRLVGLSKELDVSAAVLLRRQVDQVRLRRRIEGSLCQENLLHLGRVVSRLEPILKEPRRYPPERVEPVSGVGEVVDDCDDVVHIQDGRDPAK